MRASSTPRPELPEPQTPQADRCPKCGGELTFTSDRLGYGQTIEQCEHGVKCGHWRTLEVIRRPAHTPAPRKIREPQVAPKTTRQTGVRPATRAAMEDVASRLYTTPTAARTSVEVAQLMESPPHVVERLLRLLASEGRVFSQARRRPGRRGRPFMEYWRAA